MRVGIGYDSHRFSAGRRLFLGGIEVPSDYGLLGHSDADVLLHAIGDALLGAIGEGDLGIHFPDTDPAFKDISSVKLLARIGILVKEKGYTVNNIDATVILERPRLKEYIPQMVSVIARVFRIGNERVNIKATTNERMGFIGRGEGIAALSVATVQSLS